MAEKTTREIVHLVLITIIVFVTGLAAGAAILYFVYTRPIVEDKSRHIMITGEGYHLRLTGNDLYVSDTPVFWRGHTKKKVVALTFDDGPSPLYTEQVLAILKEKHVVATFFVVGQEAEKYPNLIQDLMAAGGEIENHSYSHPDLTLDSNKKLMKEIDKTNQIIKRLTGRHPLYIRPPKGLWDESIIFIADACGVKTALWSASLERTTQVSPQENAKRLAEEVEPGTIILAHDGQVDRTKTIETLPYLIDDLKAKGYKFVTLKELSKIR